MADRGGLGIAIALTEHDIVDARRIDPGPLDQRFQDDGPEFAGAHRRQAAAELADSGADGGDNGGAAQGHSGSPVLATPTMPASIRRAISPEDSERRVARSEEHTSELKTLMRISYAVI